MASNAKGNANVLFCTICNIRVKPSNLLKSFRFSFAKRTLNNEVKIFAMHSSSSKLTGLTLRNNEAAFSKSSMLARDPFLKISSSSVETPTRIDSISLQYSLFAENSATCSRCSKVDKIRVEVHNVSRISFLNSNKFSSISIEWCTPCSPLSSLSSNLDMLSTSSFRKSCSSRSSTNKLVISGASARVSDSNSSTSDPSASLEISSFG
mmetsp:Transcript_13247/g.23751  ORF Transcript_13247/g.23751 Transcript_13247/m.23751 type:complete len:208 (+) Transcript_13247:2050-2673(+)